jgi:hypothetical protein
MQLYVVGCGTSLSMSEVEEPNSGYLNWNVGSLEECSRSEHRQPVALRSSAILEGSRVVRKTIVRMIGRNSTIGSKSGK